MSKAAYLASGHSDTSLTLDLPFFHMELVYFYIFYCVHMCVYRHRSFPAALLKLIQYVGLDQLLTALDDTFLDIWMVYKNEVKENEHNKSEVTLLI